MDSLKQSFSAMSAMFYSKMDEFQQDLDKNSSGKTSATAASLTTDFVTFKTFIITALNTLQKQMEFLRLEVDRQEMRNRRKILLLHGVSEAKSEDLVARVTTVVAGHLDFPTFSSSSIKSCYRLGRPLGGKHRPVVVKFSDVAVRNKVWFAKTKFKGTGITQSEYLTKPRHEVFLEARKRYGVTNCWTRDGCIYIIGLDGARHRVECMSELEAIPAATIVATVASPVVMNSPVQDLGTCSSRSPVARLPTIRTKRQVKK